MILKRNRRGMALVTTLIFLTSVTIATTAYIQTTTTSVRMAAHREQDIRLLNLCEAGFQAELVALWIPFKVGQSFTTMDSTYTGASAESPQSVLTGSFDGVGKYTVGVVGYSSPNTYNRYVTLRAVGFVDRDSDGQLDDDEPRRIVESTQQFSLDRSGVFDYAYFVNNYGWMTGFGAADLIVSGDMRANGDFDFSGGLPTVNGSIYACMNSKLDPPASGIVNANPTQWDNTYYGTNATARMRQAYDSSKHGAKGTSQYETWRDLIYDKSPGIVNGRYSGSLIGDAHGSRDFSGNVLDSTPTKEVTMPDLNNLSYYQTSSQSWKDTKAAYANGTVNLNYGQGAWVDVWDAAQNKYVRLSTNGVISGNAVLIGTSAKPIKIHGPITVTQDCIIKGYVQGQGTVYTGRNVHIVGSILYKSPPDFRGSNPQTVDNNNEPKDILALAARGSIIMGNTKSFGYYPLVFMTPPFTHGRYDDYGNWIPAFDANQVDSYGVKRYQPILGDNYINGIAEGINTLDCILYTNFVGGGNLGTSGGGVTFNGSIICKDEAMVLWSLPMRMNYDNRIRERGINSTPLIDLNLPRTPYLFRAAWQNVGTYNY